MQLGPGWKNTLQSDCGVQGVVVSKIARFVEEEFRVIRVNLSFNHTTFPECLLRRLIVVRLQQKLEVLEPFVNVVVEPEHPALEAVLSELEPMQSTPEVCGASTLKILPD